MHGKYLFLLGQLHNCKNKNFMYPVLRLKVHRSDLAVNQILEMGSRYLYEKQNEHWPHLKVAERINVKLMLS